MGIENVPPVTEIFPVGDKKQSLDQEKKKKKKGGKETSVLPDAVKVNISPEALEKSRGEEASEE